jgi:uncharacterized protein
VTDTRRCLVIGVLAALLVPGCGTGFTASIEAARSSGSEAPASESTPTSASSTPAPVTPTPRTSAGSAPSSEPEPVTSPEPVDSAPGEPSPPSTTPVPDDPGDVPQAASQLPSGYTVQEFYEDYYGALELVDTWWATHWSEYFTESYTAPQLIEGYYGPGLYSRDNSSVDPRDEVRQPDEVQFTCKGELLAPDNALYCGPTPEYPAEDFVAFDIEFLLAARTLGDVFVYVIVAHEWGHAIAADLEEALVPAWYELQADCFAGAALQGAVTDGTLVWEEGDDRELVDGLTDIGSLADWGVEYTDPLTGEPRQATHGSPLQRIDWFLRGARDGVESCLEF